MKKMILLLLLMIASGCETNGGEMTSRELPSTTLSQAYPGDISDVSMIELLNGSTGERVSIDTKVVIQNWLNSVKEIELVPDDNQELRVGYLYRITLFEDEQATMSFSPNEINRIYYNENESFSKAVEELFIRYLE